MNGKSNKRNVLFIGIIVVVMVLAILAVIFITSINHYFDTHTWATVSVSGEINLDASDAPVKEQEYVKGDNIILGSVILKITDITHDGTVTFSVQQGNLYKEAGGAVNSDTLVKGVKANYKMDEGTVSLIVNSSRYE